MRYEIGQTLDEKFLIRQVYEGGMAFVYVVDDADTGKKAAAKTMRDELLDDATMVARFRRETRIWVGLGAHPNIVRAFFVKDIDSAPFLFMEYVDGGSLSDFLKTSGPLPIEQISKIALGVAEGMRYVHNRITPDGLRGILHRDLKPANVLLGEDGSIKVADFGLAAARNATLLTETCDVLGTIHYSSPEQILDSRSIDKRSDVYSFGAILYRVACGTLPFDADTWSNLVRKIKEDMPSDPIRLRSDLPEQMSRVIMKCLAKSKEERFDSFDEVCIHLSQIDPWASHGSGGIELGNWAAIMDQAQREAASCGTDMVSPVHLLLSVLSHQCDPLTSWLNARNISMKRLSEKIRSSVDEKSKSIVPAAVKFRRSSRRVIGLAHTLAERGSGTSPAAEHMIKALLREASMRETLAVALESSGASNEEIEALFDEIDNAFELSGLD